MSNLRLMNVERYKDRSATTMGYGVDEFQSIQECNARCLGNDSDLESAEIWLIEADDDKGNTLDEVLLWSGKRK